MSTLRERAKHVLGVFALKALGSLSLAQPPLLLLEERYWNIRPWYGGNCLDIGCGHGELARFLRNQGISVIALDVDGANPPCGVPFAVFDGERLPFGDDAFDTSIAMFSLHYAPCRRSQERLLREMARVTRGHVIVGEDVPETRMDRFMVHCHMLFTPWSRGRGSFHSHRGWLNLFSACGLRPERDNRVARYRDPTFPVPRRVFVLAPVGTSR